MTRPVSYVSVFLAMLLLGGLGLLTIADILDGPGTERQERVAATPDVPKDAGGIPRFLAQSRLYVGERYALKDRFVAWNGLVNHVGFNRSPAPNVVLGQNGYLYLSSQGAIEISQGQSRLRADEIADWTATFGQLKTAFDARGIQYGLIIGPNKHTIFPENLPEWVGPVAWDQTRAHDVMTVAKTVFGATFVDTRQALIAARGDYGNDKLYHPTDTHWTELGAALATQKALAALGVDLPVPEFEVATLPRAGDLSRMIGLQGRQVATAPELPRTWACTDADGNEMEIITIDPIMPKRFSCGSPDGLPTKLVIFNDSFGVSAIPFVAQHFQNVEFIWEDAANPDQAAELDADIVLHIIVERKMIQDDPSSWLLKSPR
jgi:hypothetical protein